MRLSTLIAASLAVVPLGPAAGQSLAARVAAVREGVVHAQVDSRPGTCGDGRDVIGYRSAIFARNFQSFGGHWSERRCVPGPLLVSLTVRAGEVVAVHAQVGGGWPATDARVTDVGVVDPTEASAYFFSLVPRLESASGRDRLLLPAVLAADAPVVAPLLALARDAARGVHTRQQAIQWLGLLGDAGVVPALVRFARDRDDETRSDKMARELSDAAMVALSMLEDDAGVPALIDLARTGTVETRRNAVFWLGQNGTPAARRMLHSVIENTGEESRVRTHAVFALAHGGDVPPSEFAYLRAQYPRMDRDEVKEAVFQGMQEDEGAGGRWLIERALDGKETLKLRKSALFWAGQNESTRISELVRVYREAGESSLREHAIFVLSQRKEDAATEALLHIAREDRDTRMRGKALFWLAQSDDPRVRKLIADLVLK